VFPEVYIASRMFDQLLKIEDRMGLNPSARQSIRTRAVMDSKSRKQLNDEEFEKEINGKDKNRFFE
jgi:phage terminase small subunit